MGAQNRPQEAPKADKTGKGEKKENNNDKKTQQEATKHIDRHFPGQWSLVMCCPGAVLVLFWCCSGVGPAECASPLWRL